MMFLWLLACVYREIDTTGQADADTDVDADTDADADTDTDPGTIAALEAELRTLLGDPSYYVLPDVPVDPSTASTDDYASIPQDPLNPITPEKVRLGRELFFEPGIAAKPFKEDGDLYTSTCATCHDPTAGFTSGSYLGRGIGEGGTGYLADRHLLEEFAGEIDLIDIGPWNDTRLVNVAYRGVRGGWQGEFDSTLTEEEKEAYNEKFCEISQYGYEGIECYSYVSMRSHGFFSGVETAPDESVLSPNSGLAAYSEYKEMFDAAFPEVAESSRMTRRYTTLAVAAFVRTVITSDAPFQKFLKDPQDGTVPSPMSEAELRGGLLFFGEAHCSQCHTGPGLTAAKYANIGAPGLLETDTLRGFPSIETPTEDMTLVEFFSALSTEYPPLINEGRYDVTLLEEDFGKYEIVSAYGAGAPGVERFGHGAYHDSLEAWIRHKVSGSAGSTVDQRLAATLDSRLFFGTEQWITDAQIADLVAFVGTSLTDPDMELRYGDPDHESLAGFCSPNNDPESCAAY